MIAPVRRSESVDARPATGAAPSTQAEDHRLVAVAIGAAVAIVAAFWVPALRYGLMTDELLTAWVTADGLGDTIARAQEYQGNSAIYYVLVWVLRGLVGSSEWLLRIPSALCVVAAAWHLVRLGGELDPGRRLTGAVAALVMIADTNVILRATTARAYGLLLLMAVLSARALIRYLATGSWRAGLAWVITAVGSLAMTPFAAPALIAHLVAIVDRARRVGVDDDAPGGVEAHRRVFTRLPALTVLGVVLALPMVPQVLALSRRSDELVISSMPEVADLVAALVPVSLFGAIGLGVAFGGWGGRLRTDDPALRFIGAWAGAPALVLWTVSAITGNSLWVDRYRVIAVPAFALLVGMGASRISRVAGRRVAVGALVAVSLWSVSGFAGLQQQGWREAVAWARAETAGEEVEIALDSALVELGDLALLEDPAWKPYLSGPTEHYPIEGEVTLLPQGAGATIVAYQQQVISELEATGGPIVLISRVTHRAEPDHLAAFRERLGAAGWSASAGPLVGPVQAWVFRR